MELELRPADIDLQKRAAELMRSVVAPTVEHTDREGMLDTGMLAAIGESKLLEGFLPARLGGADHDLLTLAIMLEEVAAVSAPVAMLLAVQVVVGNRLMLAFSEHPERDAIVRGAANLSGLFSLAATEVGAGCDLSAVACNLARDADGRLMVQGSKRYVNWAGRATWFAALLGQENGAPTMALIAREQAGVKIGPTMPTMGMAGLEAANVDLSAVGLSKDHLLGAEGFGLDIYERAMGEMRIALAAIGTGMAQAAFTAAAAHAKGRRQAGQPVGSFQALQWRFADMATAVDAARLHTWSAASKAIAKKPFTLEAAMAKINATETAHMVADFSVQVLGGEGYVRGSAPERLFRDSRFLKICSGTSEVLRNLIARQL